MVQQNFVHINQYLVLFLKWITKSEFHVAMDGNERVSVYSRYFLFGWRLRKLEDIFIALDINILGSQLQVLGWSMNHKNDFHMMICPSICLFNDNCFLTANVWFFVF